MITLLVVDDSETILTSMRLLLAAAGYDVVTATSGRAALASVGERKPDLIITDLNMPQMNGLELIQELRKRRETCFVPILVLTTESQQSFRDAAKKHGASGWIVKPADMTQLEPAIRKLLPHKH